jgi:acetyl-CoA acetyltransferase
VSGLPVIIGVGQAVRRDGGTDALQLALAAARAACDDARVQPSRVVTAVDFTRSASWHDGDLATRVADELSLSVPSERIRTAPTGGESPLRVLDEVASRIARGARGVTLVAGAEANGPGSVGGRWDGRHSSAAAPLASPAPARVPARFRAMRGAFDAGITRALDFFPLYENALQAADGTTFAASQAESAHLWSELSQVAAVNPYAWTRAALSPAELLTIDGSNRLVVFPYSKLLTANPYVNQGAALLVADDDTARALGVREDRFVHVVGATGADEPADPRARVTYSRNPALDHCLERIGTITGSTAADYDFLELYSCFPSMPKLVLRSLPELRPQPVSVAGGLTFFGGPGSNYLTHSVAAMVERLRGGGGVGLLHGVGMFMTKHHAVVLSDRPRPGGYANDGPVQTLPGVDVVDHYEGPGTIETYTVMYSRDGAVERGVVIGRGMDGSRFAGRVDATDASTLRDLAVADRSPVGLAGTVVRDDDGCRFHL